MYWHSSSNSIQGNIFLFWRFWQRYSPMILPACLWILCLSFNSSQRAWAPDITLFFTKKFSLSSISLSSASVKKLNSHPNSWTILLVLVCFSSTKFPESQIGRRKKIGLLDSHMTQVRKSINLILTTLYETCLAIFWNID